jgi:hypothetical protein
MSRACQLTVFEGCLKERARLETLKIRRLSPADAHPSHKGAYIRAAPASHGSKSLICRPHRAVPRLPFVPCKEKSHVTLD